MVSIAGGAGWGGLLGALGTQVQKTEERIADQDWQIAKAEKLWGYEERKHAWDVEAAGAASYVQGTEFMLSNMAERYVSINNRLKGEPGLQMLQGPEREALEEERRKLSYRMQSLGQSYLQATGYDQRLIDNLWPKLFEIDEDGTPTGASQTARDLDAAVGLKSKQMGSDITTAGGYAIPDKFEEATVAKEREASRIKNKERAEAFGKWITSGKFKSIVKFVAGGGEAGDAHWEEVKKALTEEVGAPGDEPGAIISDEKAAEIVAEKMKTGIKEGALWISSKVVELFQRGVEAIKNSTVMDQEQIREAINAAVPVPFPVEATTIPIAQADTAGAELALAEDEARGLFEVNDRSFATTDDAGMLAVGGDSNRGLIKSIDPEVIRAQNEIQRSELDLGITPSSARMYGETRSEDFIGSSEAIDALGAAGGPAADAVQEWTAESRRAKLMEDVKNLIRRAESTLGGFNAVAGSKKGDPDLTNMTIGDIHKKYGDKAVGVGQFKRRYLLDNAKKYLGYNSKELDAMIFTPENQDKFLEFGIQESGIDDYIVGKIGIDKFQANLAIRWRGLPPLSTSLKGEPSDKYGNITQVPGSEAQSILEQWKDFSK